MKCWTYGDIPVIQVDRPLQVGPWGLGVQVRQGHPDNVQQTCKMADTKMYCFVTKADGWKLPALKNCHLSLDSDSTESQDHDRLIKSPTVTPLSHPQ